jgi:hypothetical protein
MTEDRCPHRNQQGGACRYCGRKQDSQGESDSFGRARGAGPGPGGTWFAAGRGPAAGAKRRWGWPSCRHTIYATRKCEVARNRPVQLFRRGSPTPQALPDAASMGGPDRGRTSWHTVQSSALRVQGSWGDIQSCTVNDEPRTMNVYRSAVTLQDRPPERDLRTSPRAETP